MSSPVRLPYSANCRKSVLHSETLVPSVPSPRKWNKEEDVLGEDQSSLEDLACDDRSVGSRSSS